MGDGVVGGRGAGAVGMWRRYKGAVDGPGHGPGYGAVAVALVVSDRCRRPLVGGHKDTANGGFAVESAGEDPIIGGGRARSL